MLLVEDGMRKLFFEAVFIQEGLNSAGDNWLLQDLIHIWAAMHIHSQHLGH